MQYEIEVKSLLGSKDAADKLLSKMQAIDPTTKIKSEQKQLNHYFKSGSLSKLIQSMGELLTKEQEAALREIESSAQDINVRSRENNGVTFLVVKGSLDNKSAVHSHHRMEFEEPVEVSINMLDDLITSSGWELEAKWQASRQLYDSCGLTIDLYFSPGYGYLAEFEKIVFDSADREVAHAEILDTMNRLSVSKVDPARLERMYKYYNNHWEEYYGTDNIFVVK